MKRSELKQVIEIFSFWSIDKRKGDYKLPSGVRISDYLERLTSELLRRNSLAIRADGSVGELIDGKIFKPFGNDEMTTPEQQEKAIHALIMEMLH